MRDLDTNYVHLLVINTKNDLNGEVIFKYLNPKYSDHEYSYEIHEQNGVIRYSNNTSRQNFNINEFVKVNDLLVVEMVEIEMIPVKAISNTNNLSTLVSTNLMDLPEDAMFHTMLQMNISEMLKFVATSKNNKVLKSIYTDNNFWKQKVFNDYQLELNKQINWKDIYDIIIKFKGNYQELFVHCVKNNLVDCIDVLSNNLDITEIDLSANENDAIVHALESGFLDIVNILLDNANFDPSSDENVIIMAAAKNGHLSVINRLLEDERVDPSAQRNKAIIDATIDGIFTPEKHVDIVLRLLRDPRVYNRLLEGSRQRGTIQMGEVDYFMYHYSGDDQYDIYKALTGDK